ncbi:helix-turn-helix domain-containing protein, partial [Photobacterium sp. DNB22_13_2]
MSLFYKVKMSCFSYVDQTLSGLCEMNLAMLVTMNDKEILRLSAIRDVCEHRIRRSDAARILSLSVRQVQRLVTRFRESG